MVSRAPWKIVFFGTSDFSVPILERLRVEKDFEVLAAVTQPDRPTGRKQIMTAPAVKRAAEHLGMTVLQPESLKDAKTIEDLKKLGADLFLVVAYGKILPKEALEVPPSGCVNVHGSILPKYRGASPISAAIAAGDPETGITIMKMDAKMDEGPILSTYAVPIGEDDDTGTLSGKLSQAAADMIAPTLRLYLEGLIVPKPQAPAEANYTRTLERADGRIDWTKSAGEIERFVRAMRPWPKAFSVWNRKGSEMKLVFAKTSVMHPTAGCDGNGPGSLCRLSDGRLGVNAGTGSLIVERIQPEGRVEMDGKAFLNGNPDAAGAKLS